MTLETFLQQSSISFLLLCSRSVSMSLWDTWTGLSSSQGHICPFSISAITAHLHLAKLSSVQFGCFLSLHCNGWVLGAPRVWTLTTHTFASKWQFSMKLFSCNQKNAVEDPKHSRDDTRAKLNILLSLRQQKEDWEQPEKTEVQGRVQSYKAVQGQKQDMIKAVWG